MLLLHEFETIQTRNYFVRLNKRRYTILYVQGLGHESDQKVQSQIVSQITNMISLGCMTKTCQLGNTGH